MERILLALCIFIFAAAGACGIVAAVCIYRIAPETMPVLAVVLAISAVSIFQAFMLAIDYATLNDD